jgi:hypothetical protein
MSIPSPQFDPEKADEALNEHGFFFQQNIREKE